MSAFNIESVGQWAMDLIGTLVAEETKLTQDFLLKSAQVTR